MSIHDNNVTARNLRLRVSSADPACFAGAPFIAPLLNAPTAPAPTHPPATTVDCELPLAIDLARRLSCVSGTVDCIAAAGWAATRNEGLLRVRQL